MVVNGSLLCCQNLNFCLIIFFAVSNKESEKRNWIISAEVSVFYCRNLKLQLINNSFYTHKYDDLMCLTLKSGYFHRNNVENIPVVLAGDFNGCPEDEVYGFVIENGFVSSYKTVHCREPRVTHRLYSGEEILVDYIFYRWEFTF